MSDVHNAQERAALAKNAEFINAFIQGKHVEYKGSYLDAAHCPWRTVPNIASFAHDVFMFRIKPKTVKTVGYKRFVALAQNGSHFVTTVIRWDESRDACIPAGVIEWIDTEWQYAEVEVEA